MFVKQLQRIRTNKATKKQGKVWLLIKIVFYYKKEQTDVYKNYNS